VESFELFQEMKERIEDTIIRNLFRVEPASEEQMAEQRRARERQAAASKMRFSAPAKVTPNRTAPPKQVVRSGEKVGRNDPCPCGSGKKYKKCCGATHAAAS
jgi:preprotein translocase subunit SecA